MLQIVWNDLQTWSLCGPTATWSFRLTGPQNPYRARGPGRHAMESWMWSTSSAAQCHRLPDPVGQAHPTAQHRLSGPWRAPLSELQNQERWKGSETEMKRKWKVFFQVLTDISTQGETINIHIPLFHLYYLKLKARNKSNSRKQIRNNNK